MRILLTGATGFAGSYVLKNLLAKNVPVAVILREASDTWRIQDDFEKTVLIKGDFHHPEKMLSEILKFSPDTLIHTAWYGVENKYANDSKQFMENIKLTQNIIEILKTTDIRTLIGMGSQAEYGPRNAILNEEAATLPSTLYGVAKLAAYHLLRIFCEKENIRFSWFRLFSSYGPKDNLSWFVPYLMTEIKKGNIPKLTKGEQLWDYIYIEDVAQALIAAAENTAVSGVFNLGSGEVHTVRYLAETIRDMINPHLGLDFGAVPYRPDQVMHLQADITRLKEIVGFCPRVSLAEGLEKTVKWFIVHNE